MNVNWKKTLLPALAVMLLASTPALSKSGRVSTIHVEVKSADGDTTKMQLAMPVSVLNAFAGSITEDGPFPAMFIDELDGHGFDVRAFWKAIRDGQVNEFFTLQADDADVRAWREKGLFRLSVKDEDGGHHGRTSVDVSIPERLMDILLEADGTATDLVEHLQSFGPMTLVEVQTDEESVRIWLD